MKSKIHNMFYVYVMETISQLDDIFIVSGYEKSINTSNSLSKRK
nr:hypothetical protein [Mycoplasmopsis bovis]